MLPAALAENASLPAVTLTVGSPNRVAWTGVRKKGPFRPVCTSVIEPSAPMVAFPGPFILSVMAFPVCRFVNETVMAPVKRNVLDPSAVLRILVYSLLTTVVTRTLNPQNDAGRVKGAAGPNCHLCPRPARAGEAVTTPPSTHSSAPSATITPSRRLMAIPPLCGHHAVARASSSGAGHAVAIAEVPA